MMKLLSQRVRDELPFITPAWRTAAFTAAALSRVPPTSAFAEKLAFQVHRTARDNVARRLVEPIVVEAAKSSEKCNLAIKTSLKFDPNRICLLKPFVSPAEKGVIKIMFSETIASASRYSRFQSPSRRGYTLVLEPSWTGAADPELLQYAKLPTDVVVLAGAKTDYEFLTLLDSALRPINIGPCDWGDPRLAEPFLARPKRFDLLVNSTWAAWKRHFVLFQALAKLPQPIRVALVGVPWDGGTRNDVLNVAQYYGVADWLTIFEKIPFQEVIQLNCESRAAALFSLKEGSNRALTEAMLCNTPVILLDRHWGGIVKNVVPQTGVISSERDLPNNIQHVLTNQSSFTPRQWALDNISCLVSTQKLNSFLQDLALARGEPWTSGICVHSNSPECKRWDDARKPEAEEQIKHIAELFQR